MAAPKREAPPDLPPIELFLLGIISGWELPRPLFDVFLLGRLSLQRELEDAQAEVRRLDAIDADPEPRDVRTLLRPSFEEMSERRGDRALAERARERKRTNAAFGRGAA